MTKKFSQLRFIAYYLIQWFPTWGEFPPIGENSDILGGNFAQFVVGLRALANFMYIYKHSSYLIYIIKPYSTISVYFYMNAFILITLI